jgi:hypothetical protein
MILIKLLFVLLLNFIIVIRGYILIQKSYNVNVLNKNRIEKYSIGCKPLLNKSRIYSNLKNENDNNKNNKILKNDKNIYNFWNNIKKVLVSISILPLLVSSSTIILPSQIVRADDELAKYAAEGNEVGVDGQCFMKKCALQTSACANDPNCLKGLSCLARCKGGSMCSTGCFAKYGSEKLDNLLYCSVEKNDCVHVPGKGANSGWINDNINDLPSEPLKPFNVAAMSGTWYKVMGLDSRYDCFDCQKNSFKYSKKGGEDTLGMEAWFRIPRPTYPGYSQNKIIEDLKVVNDGNSIANLQSKGQMFGLTFWENWYILGETTPSIETPFTSGIQIALAYSPIDYENSMKLVFYTGHTLQGSYKGAFVYARTASLSPSSMEIAKNLIKNSGLNPDEFCLIHNQCFDKQEDEIEKQRLKKEEKYENAPFWYLGQRFFQGTKMAATELADWFQDPEILSEWLVNQQERMILDQPLAVSPFAGEGLFKGN